MSPPDTASSSSATDQNRISQAGSIECTSDKSDEIALGQQTVGLGIIEANNPKLDLPSNAKNGEPQLEHTHGVASEGRRSVPEKAASLSIDTALSSKTTMDTTSGQPKDGSTDPPPPPPKDEKYSKSPKPTPQTPELDPEKEALKREDAELEEGAINPNEPQEGVAVDDSRSEIQSIMEQFDEGMGGPGADEIMSPRLEIAGPLLGSPIAGHPPRKSSLEPLSSGSQTSLHRESSSSQPPPRSSSLAGGSIAGLGIIQAPSTSKELPDSPSNPKSQRQHPPLPPRPDPEPDLPFDFHRFLEQLRHRTADPVAKFLRSFLLEFGKKQWMVHEQVKIISDFLEFIAKKMAICEVWRTVSDAEFDNACEGMEKLVMNRLYSQTFSPAIPPPDPLLGKGKRRTGQVAPGRRGQHQEDVERDEILAQKVRIYSWVRGEHLDIKTLNEKGQRFLVLAQQELLKIGNYRAPRDKVICVLNCCKVIFGFLRNSQHDQSADSFIPLLIYTVLKANPPHLVSNVQYILRFRNANKLTGEAGYYVSSLGGAIDFIERLDRTSLTISDEEFEKNVEESVSAIAERHPPTAQSHQLPEPASIKAEGTSPRASLDVPHRSKSVRSEGKSDSENEENAAVAGLLRTIQRPLSTIGRIFSDDNATTPQVPLNQPPLTPQPLTQHRRSPLARGTLAASPSKGTDVVQAQMSAEDAAARQASKEAEDARTIRAREERSVVETLCGMFPALDREVVVDVVRANEGRIGSAVDACLALSS